MLKKAIINTQNDDNKCFLWSVLAHIYPTDKNPERVSKYKKYEKKLKHERLKIPNKINWYFQI